MYFSHLSSTYLNLSLSIANDISTSLYIYVYLLYLYIYININIIKVNEVTMIMLEIMQLKSIFDTYQLIILLSSNNNIIETNILLYILFQ